MFLSDGLPSRSIAGDEKRVFVHSYATLHSEGISKLYREECDFYDWSTGRNKGSIAQACVKPGVEETYMLWGDSHAQALSGGLRAVLPQAVSLAQIATSGCKASLVDIPGNGANVEACRLSNQFAVEQMKKLVPELLILAQSTNHEDTDWQRIADYAHAQGIRRVVLVGPTPQWHPSLPQVIVNNYWGKDHEIVRMGLDQSVLNTDTLMQKKYGNSDSITYVSLIDRLCNADGCRAVVPTEDVHDLLVMDYGHLTPAASFYVAKNIISTKLSIH